MKTKNQGLGARDDYDDVDAFGLDEFGAPAGLNPMWGAAVGSGLGTVAAIALRQMSPGSALGRHAEAAGFGVAALASGALIASRKSRAAGWTGLAAAFLNNGLRALEQYVLAPPTSASVAGVVFNPTTAFRGLGIADIERTTAFAGLGEDMPTLVGKNLGTASNHLQLVGGPAMSDLSANYGATHWNR